MGSSLLQWESDPLFSAAEVVQDSADRMESIFRLLLHEQNLVEANNYDPKLLTLIGYHSRDLATILETAKWQLEDFERAVISSARMDRSQSREAVIFRHKELLVLLENRSTMLRKAWRKWKWEIPLKSLNGKTRMNKIKIIWHFSFPGGLTITVMSWVIVTYLKDFLIHPRHHAHQMLELLEMNVEKLKK
ncbi:hypothetical protein E1A91_D04G118100v1 [Gossypium mustelinum]|uniref:Syntaxin 6/10/61 N-terminal domain-containing protein n=1 Tax=Gossypium mustelinum TaxID=34275 RepID=A0A5D2VCV1_GOSMU|nr:hypothetical protein E1A91_D04G118100v1 [Gossypium mustelinum]